MPAMKDKIFAVIDTNVIVSALISSNLESNPVKVFRAIVQERIVPLFNDEILEEYGRRQRISIFQIRKTSYSTRSLFPLKILILLQAISSISL